MKLVVFNLLSAVVVALCGSIVNAAQEPEPMAFSEIGAKASADYQGDAISVTATPEGASLRTGFQKLSGRVTEEGLWLESTEGACDGLSLFAAAVGRMGSQLLDLPTRGVVALAEKRVTWTRPGIVEEYSVSVDGVRQDFILAGAPAGTGDLSVELALGGARAEAQGGGVHLTLAGSGRKLAYSRLLVTDATGRELPARLDVLSPVRLAVRVDDTDAAYPVRIDPTFSDADWVSVNPGIPGTNGQVNAAVVDSAGNLYIGGSFTAVGGVLANNIAKWNGISWTAVGEGANGAIRALAVSAGEIYAGGDFTSVSGLSANYIAKWSGNAWSTLGSGVSGPVYALEVSGNDLYAGGDFTNAGGESASRIAKWNGSSWSALGTGLSSSVRSLAINGSDLYVGGYFTKAGGMFANRVAKWNGEEWSALGSGVSGRVYALAVSGNDLYAGGDFTNAGGEAASKIAKWNGSSWSALGAGIDGSVYALAASGSDLYAGGSFIAAGGVAANQVVKWNGSAWSALGSGIRGRSSSVYALAVSDSDLYAGGSFAVAGGVTANRIAKWNGGAWSALGKGVSGLVYALAVSGSNLYAGGDFTTAGTIAASRIAKWDGSVWSALGSGIGDPDDLTSSVNALVACDGILYAGGNFVTVGGVPAKNIAKWNGIEWSALGSGVNSSVYALVAEGSDLYAGGYFSTAGGVIANKIAKWNGSAWSALGSGMGGPSSSVHALTLSGSDLYAGGSFTAAGGVTANRIAKWNGSTWSALGTGMDGNVEALAVSGIDLYAGGGFTSAGGVAANYIAKWNGSAWSSLGTGVNGFVAALAIRGSDLYAGGGFTSAGGVPANYIAKWNGSAWSVLGTGVNDFVSDLAVNGSGLFVAGKFITAGSRFSPYVAKAIIGAKIQVEQPVGSAIAHSSTKSFGLVSQGSSADLTFTIRNTGQAGLNLTGNPRVALSGTDASLFSVTAQPASPIAADGTTTFTVRFAPTSAGAKSATLTITSDADVQKYDISLSGEGRNMMPVLGNTGSASATVGQGFSYLISATNSPFLYGAVGLPPGLVLNSNTGLIIGTPTMAGTYNVTLSATNADGTGTKTVTFTVISWPPLISSATSATAGVGLPFSYQTTASNSPTSFGASGLPGGLSMNAGTGLISGIPTASGVFSVALSATNESGVGTQTLTLTVNPAPPVIGSADRVTGVVGQAFSYQITASNSPTSYGASGLPPGLGVNTSTGLISGTPTTAGSSSITLSAANAGGAGTITLTLTVAPAPPLGGGGNKVHAVVGQSFSYPIPAVGNPSSFGAVKLPPGLWLSDGVIVGNPMAVGSFQVTVWWENEQGRTITPLVIEVQAPPAVLWSHAADGLATRVVRGDGADNVYLAGDFVGTLEVGGTTLSATAGPDGFVAKLNGMGQLLWIRQLEGDGSEWIEALAVDPAGNVHVAGTLSGSDMLAGTSLTNTHFGNGVYVAKFTASGEVAWVTSLAAREAGVGSNGALAVDAAGNVSLGGWFHGTLDDGTSTMASPAGSGSNGFIVQWNADGVPGWKRQFASDDDADIGSLAFDGSGNLLVTGSFLGSASIDGTTVSTPEQDGALLAKLTPAGSLLWAHGFPGAWFWDRNSMVADAQGGVFIAGIYSGTPAFGGTTLPAAEYGSFAARFNSSDGTLVWARDLPGSLPEIASDGQGGIYLEGFGADGRFDAVDFGGQTGRHVVKLDADGRVLWVRDSACPPDAGASDYPSLAASGAGRVYLAGTMADAVALDGETLDGTGDSNSYLWTLAPRTTTAVVPEITSALSANGTVNREFSYRIEADHAPTAYWVSDCNWCDFDPHAGAISALPQEEGTYTATIWAVNEAGAGSAILTVTIGADTSPSITSPDSAAAIQGSPFSYQITASGNPASYSAYFLPAGLSVNSSNGLISGTPTAAGSFQVLLAATNEGGSGLQWLVLTVNPALGNGIAAWRQQYFGTAENSGNAADLAAPDGDGIPNLVKYALLMTPGQDGSSRLPVASMNGGKLAVRFQRSPLRTEATIIVEAQSGLGGAWTEIARSTAGGSFTGSAAVTEADAGSGVTNVTVQDVLANASRRFMRVRVERQ